MFAFLLLVCLLTSALAVPAPSSDSGNREGQSSFASDWRIEVVDDTLGSAQTCVRIDSSDSPWISYYPPGDLLLSHKEDGNWTSEVLDTPNYGGASQSMAIGFDDDIHIVYHDSDPSELAYLYSNGSGWSREDIEYDITPEPSLRIDEYGNPHIAYLSRQLWEDFADVKYAFRANGTWNIETIADSGPPTFPLGPRVSLALDSENLPHVSYLDGYENVLKYANLSKGSWIHQVVDDHGMVGWHNSIALDSDDRPHISYFDKTNHTVKYAHWDGLRWVTEIVDYPGVHGGFTSLAIDAKDVPNLVYLNRSGPTESQSVMFASRKKGTWHIEVIDSPGYLPGWTSPSLALDSYGNPHVSYHGSADSETRYATRGEPYPPEEPLVSLDIDPDTLNLKSKGRWITAYLSAENASVYDINISSILLQDTLIPERWDYQDDILMLKFNRQALIAILEVGESVEIKLSGKWKDGTAFEAYDYIRVISPGRWIDFPWIPRPNPTISS